MRNRLLAAAAWATALASASVARAGPGARVARPDAPVSIADVKDKLVVLATDAGHYVVIEPFALGSEHFYFGDGKRLYRQRTFGGGRDGDKQFSRRFWSPRVDHVAEIGFRDGAWYVQCADRKTPLAVAPEPEAARVLDKATFYGPLWRRQAYHLSRDDRGRYYYVDRLRDEYGGKGFRLFVGFKGRMKLTKLVNVVSDSEGDIFATRRGDLRLVMGRDRKNATWHRGKKKVPLTTVPLVENLVLIYDELGVYDGQVLGTPCDYY
ncbi:MAG: hypothetical protein D6689_12760 [Deltaproteobacteria bacterium]|nr:MAG: hypothetical protein D6689_12760 [Deltaproteobacteria bacterium]